MDWPIFTILQKGLAISQKQTSQKMDRYEPSLKLEVSGKIHHQKIRLSHS